MCLCCGRNVSPGPGKIRKFTDPLVFTTFPHFLCLLWCHEFCWPRITSMYLINPALFCYPFIIIISTVLSVLWHRSKEPMGYLFWADYGCAILWVIVEVFLSFSQSPVFLSLNTTVIILLNMTTFMMNQLADILAIFNIVSYKFGHSCWHLFSALKCVFIASLLSLETFETINE